MLAASRRTLANGTRIISTATSVLDDVISYKENKAIDFLSMCPARYGGTAGRRCA